jgi:hypothetical protein
VIDKGNELEEDKQVENERIDASTIETEDNIRTKERRDASIHSFKHNTGGSS